MLGISCNISNTQKTLMLPLYKAITHKKVSFVFVEVLLLLVGQAHVAPQLVVAHPPATSA